MNGFTRIGDIIPSLLEESILTGLGYLEPTEEEIEALNASLLETYYRECAPHSRPVNQN